MVEKTTAQTLEELLAEGNALLADKERRRQLEEMKAENARFLQWGHFVRRVSDTLGPLAHLIDSRVVPEDFDPTRSSYYLRLVPWKAAWLDLRFERTEDGWELLDERDGYGITRHALRTPQEYTLHWGEDADGEGQWHLVGRLWASPETLAEALAVCHKADEQAAALLEQSGRKPSPTAVRRQATAGERLLAALNDYFHWLNRDGEHDHDV